jgi:hypothetical protein
MSQNGNEQTDRKHKKYLFSHRCIILTDKYNDLSDPNNLQADEIISRMIIFLYLPVKSPEKEQDYGNTTQGRTGSRKSG